MKFAPWLRYAAGMPALRSVLRYAEAAPFHLSGAPTSSARSRPCSTIILW